MAVLLHLLAFAQTLAVREIRFHRAQDPSLELDPETASSHVDGIAQLVLQLVDNQTVDKEATSVSEDVAKGNLSQDAAKIIDLTRALAGKLTPEAAAEAGVELTESDIVEIMHLTDKNGHLVNLEETKQGAFQGDMMPENQDQLRSFIELAGSARPGAGKPWSGGVVKYCFHPNATESVKASVSLAIQQYRKAVPCIRWRAVDYSGEHCSESPSILITSAPEGCYAYVGMVESLPSQILNLQEPMCLCVGTVIHELGHALGMNHEQSRPDRDQYVTVHWNNVRPGKEDNFEQIEEMDTSRPYDILSVMHYGRNAFAINESEPTMTAKPAALSGGRASSAEKFDIGNRIGLSQMDADQLADHYRSEVSTCTANKLGGSTCTEMEKDGKAWVDPHGQGCAIYLQMQEEGQIESCGRPFASGRYCCECGGGLRLQAWSP